MKALIALVPWLLLGCGRTANEPDAGPAPAEMGGSPSVPIPGTAGAPSTAPTGCDDTAVGAAPLGALNDRQRARSARALLGFPEPLPDEVEAYIGQDTDEPPAGRLHARAHDLALALSSSPEQLLSVTGCEPKVGEESVCREQFLERFVRRAFRRPPTDEDRADMGAVFDRGRELGGDFASGVRAVVEVTLQSPEFLYLVELGNGVVRGTATELTAHEVAARLSYFLTGAPPDEELATAADRDALDETARHAQARRLIGASPNRQQVRALYRGWFGLRFLDEMSAQALTLEERLATVEETRRFIDDVTFDGAGTFHALLTEPASWLNEPAARAYGLTLTGSEFRKVQLDATQRSGLFTQPGFLASWWRAEPSATQRGMAVLRGLLCQQVEPSPTELPISPPNPLAGPTYRDRLESDTAQPECQSCHLPLDGAGFAFEHYDRAGRFRDTDNGAPVDARGELFVGDAAGKVDGAVELLARLAGSEVAQACFVTHWLEEARRGALTKADECALLDLKRTFSETNGKVTELMLQIATRPELGLRLTSELLPQD